MEETLPIGDQIRALRKAKGLSTASPTTAIGKSTGFVNRIEHERTAVTVCPANCLFSNRIAELKLATLPPPPLIPKQ